MRTALACLAVAATASALSVPHAQARSTVAAAQSSLTVPHAQARSRVPVAQYYGVQGGTDVSHAAQAAQEAIQLPVGWTIVVDQASGQPYYYNQDSGQSQWEPPPQAVATKVIWRLEGLAGVAGFSYQEKDKHYASWGLHAQTDALPYTVRNGEEQVLSRWNMIKQKLTVSRKQCIVKILADGTATLISCGRAPTLWRTRGGGWVALQDGENLVLTDGDQVSLDSNDPEAAVFMCIEETATPQDGYTPQGQALPDYQLPYPWEQLVDPNGAIYYSNPQTGVSSWDPPQPGDYGAMVM